MFSVAKDYGEMTTHVKRGYIRELAKKEGVDESRSGSNYGKLCRTSVGYTKSAVMSGQHGVSTWTLFAA